MKNKITLDTNHPDKIRAEFFLNRVNENLEQIPFDAQELSGVDDIMAGFKFKGKEPSTFVTLIFASSYSHAIEIEAANLLVRPSIKWTVNGAILFGVESANEHASSQMLSFFAGRE